MRSHWRCNASIEGSAPRVKTGSPVRQAGPARFQIVRRSSLASIACTISWLRMYSNRMSVSEAVPLPIEVKAPRSPAAAKFDLLGADREGDLGMVLVGGAGVEIDGRREERHQHQCHESGKRHPVPEPRPRSRHGAFLYIVDLFEVGRPLGRGPGLRRRFSCCREARKHRPEGRVSRYEVRCILSRRGSLLPD